MEALVSPKKITDGMHGHITHSEQPPGHSRLNEVVCKENKWSHLGDITRLAVYLNPQYREGIITVEVIYCDMAAERPD
jgi:hypothetical protein